MKERPIPMSTEMAKTILDGKTQTRRVIKPQPPADAVWVFAWFAPEITRGKAPEGCYYNTDTQGVTFLSKCPYGQVGDRLWVRETWYYDMFPQEIADGVRDKNAIYYRVDGEASQQFECLEKGFRWQPSIHMPRWASRITLEIVKVRVERLQEITEEDAKAEGISQEYIFKNGLYLEDGYSYRRGYRRLWNSTNAKHPWESNPFVWVIELKQIPREATM